jgi:hypothetical protein
MKRADIAFCDARINDFEVGLVALRAMIDEETKICDARVEEAQDRLNLTGYLTRSLEKDLTWTAIRKLLDLKYSLWANEGILDQFIFTKRQYEDELNEIYYRESMILWQNLPSSSSSSTSSTSSSEYETDTE